MSLSSTIILVLALLFFGGIAVLARTSRQQSAPVGTTEASASKPTGGVVSKIDSAGSRQHAAGSGQQAAGGKR